MTTDPFTEAARAEAWRRHPDSVDIETGEPVDDWGFEEQGRRDFQAGAEWARTHLAAQEPTDAEVRAAKAAAWDEGYIAPIEAAAHNPYRETGGSDEHR